MTRRSFFSRMIAAGVAATIDPDQLLWVPGKVHYSIPAKPKVTNLIVRGTWELVPILPEETHAWFDALTAEYFAAPVGESRQRVVSRWS